jgi:RNA recognition motif-containing protein
VELRDLPYNFYFDKVDDLFKKYNIYPMSPLLGFRRNGLMTGFACVLCKNNGEAEQVVNDLNNTNIQGRTIGADVITYGDYQRFS